MTTEGRLLEELTIDDFRNRLTILYPKAAIDSRGNEIITYTEGPIVWAYVEVHATGMSTSSSESHITRKVLLVFRYRNDLSPADPFPGERRNLRTHLAAYGCLWKAQIHLCGMCRGSKESVRAYEKKIHGYAKYPGNLRGRSSQCYTSGDGGHGGENNRGYEGEGSG